MNPASEDIDLNSDSGSARDSGANDATEYHLEHDRALEALFLRQETRAHAIDMRLSIPVFRWRFYMVVLGGTEQRHAERQARDRIRFPLFKLGNALFLGGILAAIYAFALMVVFVLDRMSGI